MQTYTNLLHVINCTRRARISANDRKVASKSRIPYAFSCGYVYRGYFLFKKKKKIKRKITYHALMSGIVAPAVPRLSKVLQHHQNAGRC